MTKVQPATNTIIIRESEAQSQYQSEVTTAVLGDRQSVSAGIKVTVHVPKDVREPIRQQKINKIYDILSPKTSL